MADHIPELTQQAIKRAYMNREGSKNAIAKRFGVSESSVKRIVKDLGPALVVTQNAIANHVAETVKVHGLAIDTDQLLVTAINDLSAEMATVPAKSKEGVATAIARMIDMWRKYHPMTMHELVDLAIATPGFDPREFAKLLRERYESKAS